MIKIWKDISMLWKNEVNIFSTLGQHLVNSWSTYQWLTFGVGTMKNVQNMTKKSIFWKVCNHYHRCHGWLGTVLGVLFYPWKRFTITFKFVEEIEKIGQKSSFLTLNCPNAKKINFMTVLADAFDVVQIDWDVVKYFPARFWKAWSLYFWVPKKYWS